MRGVERLYWLLKSLREPVAIALSFAAGVFVSIWTAQDADDMFTFPGGWWAIAAAAIILFYGIGLLTFLKPTYRSIAQSEANAQTALRSARKSLQNSIDTFLLIQLRLLKLDEEPGVRISVYSVEGPEFVLIARRSKNPDYERRGRAAYPLRQGVIGEAWRNDSALLASEAETRDEWEAECVALGGFSAEEARHLTMMARSIVAVRLDTRPGQKVGMLVVESEDQAKFTRQTIVAVRRSAAHHGLIDLLDESHTQFPRVIERAGELEGKPSPTPILDEPVWKNPPPTGL